MGFRVGQSPIRPSRLGPSGVMSRPPDVPGSAARTLETRRPRSPSRSRGLVRLPELNRAVSLAGGRRPPRPRSTPVPAPAARRSPLPSGVSGPRSLPRPSRRRELPEPRRPQDAPTTGTAPLATPSLKASPESSPLRHRAPRRPSLETGLRMLRMLAVAAPHLPAPPPREIDHPPRSYTRCIRSIRRFGGV
jgi:hypothetical protein